jgi:FkbM family methyltransferase
MSFIKSGIQRLFSGLGFEVHQIVDETGRDPLQDMRKLATRSSRVVVMDVGANVGQLVLRFRSAFKDPSIHAFEPGESAFAELQRRTSAIPDVHLNHFALGAQSGSLELVENTDSSMSSLLEPGTDYWGSIKQRRPVKEQTLDEYCAMHRVNEIDILKSDTQGFDLEVLKGANQMLTSRRVHMVFLEITFSDMYKRLPRLDDIYGFLIDRGFQLVAFYKFHYRDYRARWTDALFVNPQYHPTPAAPMTSIP